MFTIIVHADHQGNTNNKFEIQTNWILSRGIKTTSNLTLRHLSKVPQIVSFLSPIWLLILHLNCLNIQNKLLDEFHCNLFTPSTCPLIEITSKSIFN